MFIVKIAHLEPADQRPAGKLAHAELHFTEGPLKGLRLVGFDIWKRRTEGAGFNLTWPARTYSVNGERRSFSLLRPIEDTNAQDALRDLILAHWDTYRATFLPEVK